MSDSTFPQNPQCPQGPYGPEGSYGSQNPHDSQASLGQQSYQHNPLDPLGQQPYPQGLSAAGQVPPAPKEKKKGGCFKWGGRYRRGCCCGPRCGGQLDRWRRCRFGRRF